MIARALALGVLFLSSLGFLQADAWPQAEAAPPRLKPQDPASRASLPPPLSGRDVVKGKLGRELDRLVQESTFGGVLGAALVARGNEVLLAKGYGFADYGTRRNDVRTLFEIASVSKSFTATAILKLEMEAKLRVEDSIDTVIDEVSEDKAAITIQHLLSHTSGISPQGGLPYSSGTEREAFVARALSKPLVFEPGTKFRYSNVGYAVLAAIVERASGQSFEDYCHEALFRPVGMKDTGFIRDPRLDAERAATRLSKPGRSTSSRPPRTRRDLQRADPSRSGLTPRGSTSVDWFWGWGYRGMGGVVTTIADLWRWEGAIRQHRVLSEEATRRLLTPQLEGYAAGWHVETTDSGRTRVHHSGGVAGFRANLVRYPEERVLIVLLSNDSNQLHSITEAIEAKLFAKREIRARIDITGCDTGPYHSLKLPGSSAWTVQAEGAGVMLRLQHGETRKVIAEIGLSRARAEGVAKRLRSLIVQRQKGLGSPDAPDSEGPPVMGSVALRPYGPVGKPVELTADLTLKLLARYNAGSKREVDRITLVLFDSARGFWPVHTKLSDGAVAELLAQLEEATAVEPAGFREK